ncbi:MAG: hypothetical protein WAK75_00020 [Methanoregula sp.]|uniref:hypothetical protein n=1 Tax=Methanoregula sp. TaxID=2052170 RepID=UPI003BAFD4E4
MASNLLPSEIPQNRTDVLHLLRQHDDDLDELSTDQLAAIRKIYRLDDPRTITELIAVGEITVSKRDIEEIKAGGFE